MTINQNIKALNFTGVNHESNERLIKNLEFSIANIEPRGAYHINLLDDLVKNIARVKHRLELYQNFMERSRESYSIPEYRPVAKVVLKNGGFVTVDIFREGNAYIDDITGSIIDAFKNFDEYVKFEECSILTKDIDYVLFEDKKVLNSADYRQSPLIAMIVMNDATAFPIDSVCSGEITTREIVDRINEGIATGKEFITIGGTKIFVNLIWYVRDDHTNEQFIINDDNDPEIPPISLDTIPKMHYKTLSDTIYNLIEYINNTDIEDEQETLTMLLIGAIEELQQRYCDESYERERVENILNGFVMEHQLEDKFTIWLKVKKLEQDNPEDKYEVAKEIYGNIDEFMKNHGYYLRLLKKVNKK
jgi:hypothetical protein